MKSLFEYVLAAAICTLSVLGCTGDGNGSGQIVYKGQKQLVFSDEGGVRTITFETPERWTASVTNTGTTEDLDWAEIDVSSGEMGTGNINVSVTRNTGDSERTAALSVFCGGDVLVVSIVQSAAGEEGEGQKPDISPTNVRVSRIAITFDDNYREVYSLKYDGNYVAEILSSCYNDGVEEDVPSVLTVRRERGKVIIEESYWDDGSLKTDCEVMTLDGKGRAVEYLYKDEDSSEEYVISYNSDGTLAKSCNKDGRDSQNYIWSGGNLTTVDSDKFIYSEYKNNANIDLNWAFTGGYGSGWPIFGMLGLLGERSVNYVIPKTTGDVSIDPHFEEPIPCDGEYTYTEVSYIRVEADADVDYKFDNDNLVSAKSSVPVYRIETLYKVYRTITNYDHFEIGPDGQKLYSQYQEKVLSTTQTSKEKIRTDSVLFEIDYL